MSPAHKLNYIYKNLDLIYKLVGNTYKVSCICYNFVISKLFTIKILLTCGILASLLYVGSDIIASISWEGYSYASQTVSELRAIGSPTRAFLIPTLFVYAALEIAFGFGVWKTSVQKRTLRITGGLLMGLGILDLMGPLFALNINEAVGSITNITHMVVTVLTMVILLLIIGFGAFSGGKRILFYSFTTIIIFFMTGTWAFLDVPRIAAGLPTPWLGIRERFGIYSYMLWMLILAVFLLRLSRKAKHV